jgi:HJR/Mrr/RecB family endonuclease
MSRANAMRREDAWAFFEWNAARYAQLVKLLSEQLCDRYNLSDEEDQAAYNCDHEQKLIDVRWKYFVKERVSSAAELMNIDMSKSEFYNNTLRRHAAEFFPSVHLDDVVAEVSALLASRYEDGQVFRPLCLAEANSAVMAWLRSRPEDVDYVHHRSFELIVAEVVADHGWTVELTKQTRDNGYDIMCLKNESLGFPITMVIEAKLRRGGAAIGLAAIDRLAAVRQRENVNKGVLVTNSRVSGPAWRRWQASVGRELDLVERATLLDWLRAYSPQTASPEA